MEKTVTLRVMVILVTMFIKSEMQIMYLTKLKETIKMLKITIEKM